MPGGEASTFAAFLSCANRTGEHERTAISAANAFMIFMPNSSKAKTPAPRNDSRGLLSIPDDTGNRHRTERPRLRRANALAEFKRHHVLYHAGQWGSLPWANGMRLPGSF